MILQNNNTFKLHLIFLWFLLIGPLVGCQAKLIAAEGTTLYRAYDNAVVDAAFPQEGEIANDLTAITPANTGLTWD